MFKNILIPVDLTISSEVAIGRAMELADKHFAILHLLHVATPPTLFHSAFAFTILNPTIAPKTEIEIFLKLNKLKDQILCSHPSLIVQVYNLPGSSVNKVILDVANIINPELIIIASMGKRHWFNFSSTTFPNRIAKKTGCPVLTIKTGAAPKPVKNIVLPLGAFVPLRKIEWVSMLAKMYRARIHIVTMSTAGETMPGNLNKIFIETYRRLKDGLSTPIEYEVLTGTSFARSVLSYAQKIKADMVLVNPETESRISSMPGMHINDMLAANSPLQILSLEPYTMERAVPLVLPKN